MLEIVKNQGVSRKEKIKLVKEWLEVVPLQIKLEEMKLNTLEKKLEKKYVPKSMLKVSFLSFFAIFLLVYFSSDSNLLFSHYFILNMNVSTVLTYLIGNLYVFTLVASIIDEIKNYVDYKKAKQQKQEVEKNLENLKKSLEENKAYLKSLLEKESSISSSSEKKITANVKKLEEEKIMLEELKHQWENANWSHQEDLKTYIKK